MVLLPTRQQSNAQALIPKQQTMNNHRRLTTLNQGGATMPINGVLWIRTLENTDAVSGLHPHHRMPCYATRRREYLWTPESSVGRKQDLHCRWHNALAMAEEVLYCWKPRIFPIGRQNLPRNGNGASTIENRYRDDCECITTWHNIESQCDGRTTPEAYTPTQKVGKTLSVRSTLRC